MPILVSAGNDEILIEDMIGPAFQGNAGLAGNQIKLRSLWGTLKVFDINIKGHMLQGLIRKIELPVTGTNTAKIMRNAILI